MKLSVIAILGLLMVPAAFARQPGACYDGQVIYLKGVKLVCREGVWFRAYR